MSVELVWQGPVGPGCAPGAPFPDDPLLFENLCEAGVYLRIKSYDNDRTIAYAGQSVSLLARFDQHLASMLSLAAPLRDSAGEIAFTGDAAARIDAYGRLEDATALAAADAGRVRFWYALCDDYFHTEHLNLAEGLLQRRIAARLSSAPSDVENAKAAPGAMPDEVPDIWINDFSGLDPNGAALLRDLLGDDVMSLDMLAGNAA
ncbi:unnamed protein product [Discosporangium mesarthrocarpum]